MKHEKKKKYGLLLATICVLFTVGLFLTEEIKANAFSDAKIYYETYGNTMMFQAGSNNQGEIYYGTRGKNAAGAGITYYTLGWQVTIQNANGEAIDYVYFLTGGDSQYKVDRQEIDGYTYTLFRMTLEEVRSRLSPEAVEVLNTSDCKMVFDACIIVKINGEPLGGITEDGPSWGTVYTTYEGIVNAQDWSQGTKNNLKNYFNKTIDSMYYEVSADLGEGIASVSGLGRYCHGATVSVTAFPENTYQFGSWRDTAVTQPTMQFVLYGNTVVRPVGERKQIQVHFNGNDENGNPYTATEIYRYMEPNQRFPSVNWSHAGYHLIGWSHTAQAVSPDYSLNCEVSDAWILQYEPEVNLHGVWAENTYTLVFHGNGGAGNVASRAVTYNQRLVLPNTGFTRSGAQMIGWSLNANASTPAYSYTSETSVSQMVRATGQQYVDQGIIHLYAIWDYAPSIQGETIYLPLEDAKSGRITEEILSQYVQANDQEDGIIAFGSNSNNSFRILDFSSANFQYLAGETSLSLTFSAIDSAGNQTLKPITITLVDTTIYEAEVLTGSPRFLSPSYILDPSGNWLSPSDGGLSPDSIWRTNPTYTQYLLQILTTEN